MIFGQIIAKITLYARLHVTLQCTENTLEVKIIITVSHK